MTYELTLKYLWNTAGVLGCMSSVAFGLLAFYAAMPLMVMGMYLFVALCVAAFITF